MRVVESLSDVVSAKPAALVVLENIGDVRTYHDTYKVRHPLAAYNTSLASVSQRILKVFEALSDVQKSRTFESTSGNDWEAELIDATDHMLDSIMEHLEDCVGIIRSFFPDSKGKNFKNAQKKFNSSISSYRDYIGKIVNYIKHNQGRLRIISFSWSGESSLGYFVEGPVTGGGLGPVSVVHPDESSAFSYYRDLPFHLCNIFAVSRRLAVTLQSVNKNLVPRSVPKQDNEKSNLVKALEQASDLPTFYFEDEISKGVPSIKISANSIKIDCPSKKIKARPIPGGARVKVSYRGDGHTRSYKFPYLKKRS